MGRLPIHQVPPPPPRSHVPANAQLLEQHCALFAAEADGPRVRDLLAGVDATVDLRNAQRVVPHRLLPVHLYRRLPVLGVAKVLFRFAQVALRLELLRDEHVRGREVFTAVRLHEPDHVVVHLGLLVHRDGLVDLVAHHIRALRLLELVRHLELACLLAIESALLSLRQVAAGHLLCGFPLACAAVHVDGVDRHVSFDVVALGLAVIACLFIVLADALVVGQRLVMVKVVDDAGGLGELPALDRRLNRLFRAAGLDEVVDRGVHLLLREQPVAPRLLDRDDL
eukprot:366417-Chlamydomonas_euryale.AAC.25